MTDFETHPAGTADLMKVQRNLEHWRQEVGKLHSRVATLTDQLTRANAATAAAYEVASKAVAEAPVFADDDTDGETVAKVITLGRAGKAIRALATPDQTAALDRLIAEAVENAAEIAAQFVHNRLYEANIPACSYHSRDIKAAILAASTKGGV